MIKILGHPYSYCAVNGLARDCSNQGQANPNTCAINYDPSITISAQEEALLHELIEVINFECELELKHPAIQTLSAMWHAIIKDNPGIFTMRLPERDE
jgi:hypothetical protein